MHKHISHLTLQHEILSSLKSLEYVLFNTICSKPIPTNPTPIPYNLINLSPINKSYTYPHQSSKSTSNRFYTYPQINTNALNFLLNKRKWQIPAYAKYLYQVVARENGASRKFATIPRPPRVAGCSHEPLPQCSTSPNKMIPYQPPTIPKQLEKMLSIRLPKLLTINPRIALSRKFWNAPNVRAKIHVVPFSFSFCQDISFLDQRDMSLSLWHIVFFCIHKYK